MSSTLAALGGCAPSRPAAGPGASPVVSVPETPGAADADPAPPARAPESTGRKALPSLEMPDGIGPEAREAFQRLFANVQRIHPILDAMDVPEGCSILDARCEDRWRQLAAKHNELREIQTFMYSCPGSSSDAKLYAEREQEHLAAIGERLKTLQERAQKALEPDGQSGQERWDRMQEEAYAAAPYPCLSIACKDW